jgi:hypothetical protein
MKFIAIVLFALLVAGTASAIDPVCDPSDPAYVEAFDPATGDYIRPNRDVRFCSSILPENTSSTADLVCTVTVDGNLYAQATRKQGEEILVSKPDVVAGPLEIVCEIPGVDVNGDPTSIASIPVNAVYNPTPVVEPPVPLD